MDNTHYEDYCKTSDYDFTQRVKQCTNAANVLIKESHVRVQ